MFTTRTAPNSATADVLVSCESTIPANHPNRLNCAQNQADGNTWAAARSRHTGGVNAAFADGSVRFMRDSITVSVWNALGTKMGGEANTNY